METLNGNQANGLSGSGGAAAWAPEGDATLAEADAAVQSGRAALIDVRGFDEFAAGHARGAVCIPLPDLERRAAEIPTDRTVYLCCFSGERSAIACERLEAIGMRNVESLPGGFGAWEREQLPAVRQRGVIPLERQVRGVAGAMVFLFTLAGLFGGRIFLAGSLFVGFMLFLSAVTGLCPMLSLLRRMPWNRVASQAGSGAGAACGTPLPEAP